ncbi:MAG: DEAD/DEAH box helicase [Candidatus Thermoplasmatota archaeon]|nr:DEAD/DEAH box helicase [Candidatus Thermoplasmatota archaeon]MED6305342.1 DEAD/DEAH box helicase [Candidatus Thermoplasmatota archaeon]
MKINPRLSKALESRGLAEPTLAQSKSWPTIGSGSNVLLIAPTGVGKTEAAMVPLFHRLLEEKSKPITVLYITPLRSLNRDMLRRLKDIGEELGISVAVRHGDTSATERNRQSKNPPQIQITTPETLQIMLSGKRLRENLKGIQAVVVDEVHELASSERGAQLSIALERLVLLSGEFQRIGLSATVGTPDKVGSFLVGDRKVEIITPNLERKMDLLVHAPEPVPEDDELVNELYWEPERVAALRYSAEASKTGPTLLFVNTRDTAEAMGVRWNMWDENASIHVHHGSLSKGVRIEAEEDYRQGKVNTLICTSSLELGIDVGNTALVLQYNSPRDPSRMSQRLGRSGHRIKETAIGRVVSTEATQILESAVIARRTLAGELEPSRIRDMPMAVLANQIISWTVCDKNVEKSAFLDVIRRAHPFRKLNDVIMDDLLELLDQVHQNRTIGKSVRQGPRAMKYFHGNLSLIPDQRTYGVRDITTRKMIGRLDERFILDLAPGDRIVFRGSVWSVVEIDEQVMVSPSSSLGELPRWIGEDIPVPHSVALEASERLSKGDWEGLPVTDEARAVLDDYQTSILDAGVMPSPDCISIEQHERLFIVSYPGGSRLNRTIGMIITAMLSARSGYKVGYQFDPYRIILDAPLRTTVKDMLAIARGFVPGIGNLLRFAIRDSPALKSQLLHSARKMGAIGPEADVSRFGMRRLIEAYSDTPLYTEAVERFLFHQLDEEGMEEFIEKINSGQVSVVLSPKTPHGYAGLDPYRDYLKPPKSDSSVVTAVRRRLLRTDLSLKCLACDNSRKRKVRGITKHELVCPKCNSRMVAILHPMEMDREVSEKKLLKSASLAKSHGARAAMVIAGRGVGPDTAGRILRKQQSDDSDLVKSIIEAEITYARTRRFWD